MKIVRLVCAIASVIAAAAAPVRASSQIVTGQRVAERDRLEALQHYRAGQVALHSERFDIAEQEFQKAAKLDPTLELAPYGLGLVYMATKRYRSAVIAYEKCRDVNRTNAVTVAGDEMAHQRRIDNQITALEDTQRLYQQPGRNPNNIASRAYLQTLDMQIRALKDARRRTITGPEPTPAWISIALGSAYFRADAMVDAEREYRAAIAVDPKLGEAHNNLAVVLMLSGRYPEAETEVKAAESAGFKVNPQLKEDLKAAAGKR